MLSTSSIVRSSNSKSNLNARRKLGTAALSVTCATEINPVIERLEGRTLMSAGSLSSLFPPQNTDFGGTDTARAVVVQPDNKVVVAGTWDYGSPDFAVARYNADGSLDSGFGGGVPGAGSGKTSVTFGSSDYVNAVALQPDGKIVVVGYTNATGTGDNDFAIARFNADGSVDTSFNGTGKQAINFGFDDRATGVAIQPDGKIVVGGSEDFGSSDFAIVRLNADGSPDHSFGIGGTYEFSFGAGHNYAQGLALQSDGKIVMVGYGDYTADGSNDFAIARLTTSGFLDTSFNGTGEQTVSFGPGQDEEAQGVAIQSNGQIVVAGWMVTSGDTDFALTRLNPNGSVDTSFGSDGRSSAQLGYYSYGQAVAIQSDGKIVVAGTSDDYGPNYSFAIARFNVNGLLDSSFNGDGSVTYNAGGTGDAAYGLAISGDGNIYAAGTSNSTGNFNFETMCIQGGEYADTPTGLPFNVGDVIKGAQFDNGGEGVAYHSGTNDYNIGAPDGDPHARSSGLSNEVGALSFVHAGEWAKYTLNVPAAGRYALTVFGGSHFSSGGTYHVEFTATDGTVVTTPEIIVGGLTSAGAYPTITLPAVDLKAGQQVMRVVFDSQDPSGYVIDLATLQLNSVAPLPGKLTGTVFSDTNIDGKLESGEAGMANVGVYLDANNNGKFDVGEQGVVTNSNGAYSFSNLPAGSYHVRLETPNGYGLTSPTTGVYNVSLLSGQTITDNFGITNKAIISGTLYFDANKNGKQDSGEPGLPNWGIFLDTNNNGVLNVGEIAVLTDSQGHYKLVLPPGTYHVREIVQSGFKPTAPSTKVITLTVKAGQLITNVNFGDH